MKKRMWGGCAALGLSALLLSAAGAAEPAGTPVPVANGDFEAGLQQWENGGQISEEIKHGGAKALMLKGGFVYQAMKNMIPVEAGSDYRLKLWIKTEGCAADSVGICANQRGTDGKSMVSGWVEGAAPKQIMDNGQSPVLAAAGGTTDWTEVTINIPATQIAANAGFLHLYLRYDLKKGDKGTVYIDDITCQKLPAGTIPTGPVIKNGDFSKGKAGWWGDGKWDLAADKGKDGGAALQVVKGFVCQDKRPVLARKNYKISMDIKTEGCADGAVYVQTSYRGSAPIDGWHGPLQVNLGGRTEPAVVVTGGTQDWKTYSIVVQAPPAANQILLYLRKQSDTGVAYFDNVSIEQTEEKPFTAAAKRQQELVKELLPEAPAGTDAAALLAAAAKDGTGAASGATLAEGGKALAHIHTTAAADVVTLGAVKELADYLQRISGADFRPISHDGNPLTGPLVVVGRESELAKKICADVKWDELGPDGFILRTAGKHLVIAGNTPRGTMYGVNWFLDRVLGVRWLSPEYTYIPERPTLKVAALNDTQKPRFGYREVLSHEGSERVFKAHNLYNGESHGPSFSATKPELDCWNHEWMAKGGSANFMELLPQKIYGKEHPDWYGGGQVNMMNKGMRAAMAKEVIKRLQAHPDPTSIWYNIWQMDWGWDMDPASKAFAAQHGGVGSAPRLDMMLDILGQVKKAVPGARMACQAYSWGFTPPQGMSVPDDLLIFPMTLHVNYKFPLNKADNEKMGKDMIGWTKLAKNVIIWDHIANWAGFLQPSPNLFPIGESIQWLAAEPGIYGYFAEGDWNSAGGEFSGLRAWMIARLTWDPKLPVKDVLADYCNHYYGKAGPAILEYIELVRDAALKGTDIFGQRYQPDLPTYNIDFIVAAEKLMQKAVDLTKDDAVRLKHVEHVRMQVDYLGILRRQEYEQAAKERGLQWTADLPARRARFEQALKDNKVTEYLQAGKVKDLLSWMDVERKAAEVPDVAAQRTAEDWRDIQDMAFWRFGDACILTDAAASDNAAIRMSGKDSTWAIQLPIERVPQEGTWELYAYVRIDAEEGHEAEPGARVGSSPPMGLFNTLTIGDLSDGKYHAIKVPGGPFQWQGDNRLRSIYIQSPAKPYIKWVYLDRIAAVRVKK